MRAADGDKALPSYSFDNYRTTGIYMHGADDMGFVADGGVGLRLTSTAVTVYQDLVLDNTNIVLDTDIAANKSSGITIKIGTTTLVVNKVYRYSALNTWTQTDNTTAASAGASGLLGYASVGGVASTVGIVTQGVVFDSAHGFTVGAILYLTTSGNLTTTLPTTSAYTVRIMGYALTADEIYFDPDNTYIELD